MIIQAVSTDAFLMGVQDLQTKFICSHYIAKNSLASFAFILKFYNMGFNMLHCCSFTANEFIASRK